MFNMSYLVSLCHTRSQTGFKYTVINSAMSGSHTLFETFAFKIICFEFSRSSQTGDVHDRPLLFVVCAFFALYLDILRPESAQVCAWFNDIWAFKNVSRFWVGNSQGLWFQSFQPFLNTRCLMFDDVYKH